MASRRLRVAQHGRRARGGALAKIDPAKSEAACGKWTPLIHPKGRKDVLQMGMKTFEGGKRVDACFHVDYAKVQIGDKEGPMPVKIVASRARIPPARCGPARNY